MTSLLSRFTRASSLRNLSQKFSPSLYHFSNRFGVTDTQRFREVWHDTDSLDPLYDLCKKNKDGRLDPTKRAHIYFCYSGCFASGVIFAKNTIQIIAMYLSRPRDAIAMSKLEVALDDIDEGECVIVLWKDQPVYIWHRTDQDIKDARADDNVLLRDPQKDSDRCKDPHWYISMAICTHLGCLPAFGKGQFGGFFCPCHGSHYDKAGRIRKGPAARNFDIPKYKFTEDNTIVIG